MLAHIPLAGAATDADVLRIGTANPGWRIERDPQGELTLSPPTGGESSRRNVRLSRLLDEWARANGYVAYDSNGGFLLPDNSVVAPDGALVARSRYEALSTDDRERFVPLVPDVAVELVSRTDRADDLRSKLLRLRRLGTSYVVLADPYKGEMWTDGDAPAGFAGLDLAQLLRPLDP